MHRATTAVALLAVAVSLAWPQVPEVSTSAIDELRSARTAYILEIGEHEASAILSAIEPVRKLQEEFARWAGEQWNANGEKVQAAIKAWAAGQEPTPEKAQAAQELLKAGLEKRGQIQEALVDAATKALEGLGEKAQAVETPEQAQRRRLDERRFWGARNAAEAVLAEAEALRLLMPDDHALVRVAEAERLANAIAGGTAPPELVDTVLGILDHLVDLPPQAFVADRQALLADVARQLNLPPEVIQTPAVTWDEFLRWLAMPETQTVLATIAGKSMPTRNMLPEDFETTFAQLRVFGLIWDLNMSPGQVRAFAQLAQAIAGAVREASQVRRKIAEDALQAIPGLRKALKEHKPPEAETADQIQKVLAADDEREVNLKLAMLRYLRNFRRILAPPQRQLVDWVPPGDVQRLVPAQVRTVRLRQRAALIQQALEFLNRLKYQTAKRYMNLKVSQSQQFVAAFVPPDSPDFDRAMDFVLNLVTEARMVPREDWENGADVEFATRLMRGLGVLRDDVVPPPTGDELYDWQTLYDLLTAKGALSMFAPEGANR